MLRDRQSIAGVWSPSHVKFAAMLMYKCIIQTMRGRVTSIGSAADVTPIGIDFGANCLRKPLPHGSHPPTPRFPQSLLILVSWLKLR
jgi:hypothetical protein